MSWLNVFGIGFLIVILTPNAIFALKCPQGFENQWQNRWVETIEQIGRFGCMAFMAVNIPGTWFGWWSDEAFAVYLIADTLLAAAYCLIWILCFRKNNVRFCTAGQENLRNHSRNVNGNRTRRLFKII